MTWWVNPLLVAGFLVVMALLGAVLLIIGALLKAVGRMLAWLWRMVCRALSSQ